MAGVNLSIVLIQMSISYRGKIVSLQQIKAKQQDSL